MPSIVHRVLLVSLLSVCLAACSSDKGASPGGTAAAEGRGAGSEPATAGAEAVEATLQGDRAAVDTAKLNLQYTRINAPITGRTGSLTLHEGDLVRANDATPLLIINQMSPIYVTFSVPGRYLVDIRHYQAQHPLQVEARVQPGTVQPGSATPAAPPPAPGGVPSTESPVPGTPITAAMDIVTLLANAV